MSSIFTGTVYKIVCSLDDRIIYIGSTFNQLRHRWQQHKNNYNKYLEGKNRYISIFPYFTKYGIENFKIMKIKDYKCYREHNKDARHLHVFEQLWINKTRNCINQNNPFCIKKLSKKQYREVNRDKISEQRKEYYEVNKDKISEQKKEYYEANKDKLSDYYKEYREANKDKISERNKKYREVNKDKLSEQKKEYREANKDKLSERKKQRVNCSICDKELARSSLQRHMKTIHYAIE